MSYDFTIKQDGFKSRIVTHEATGEVGHICEQIDRNKILERNRELRKNPGALQDLSFGRQIASIPFEDWDVFKKEHPDYYFMSGKEKQKCLLTWLNTTVRGSACLVQDNQYKCKTKYHEVKK